MQHEEHTEQSQGLCENCLPDATVWATSTPVGGPKSYFVLIKDGAEQIALELKYSKEDKKIIAEPYRPADYDYTIHDGCDHERGECICDTEEFQEQAFIDDRAIRAGYKEPEGTRPHIAFSSDLRMSIEGCLATIEEQSLKVDAIGETLGNAAMENTGGKLRELSKQTAKTAQYLRIMLDMPKDEE